MTGSRIRNSLRMRELGKLSEVFRDLLLGLNPEMVEEFLELLLNVMRLTLWVDRDYHRNIQNFEGKYLFESKDGNISVSAVFKRSSLFNYEYLEVSEKKIEDADITVTFKDSKILMGLLLSPNPDILGALLENAVVVTGNINYIFKFGFMTTQLQQMILSRG